MRYLISVLATSMLFNIFSNGLIEKAYADDSADVIGKNVNKTGVKCISENDVNNQLQPVILMGAMIECVRQNKYDEATFLYAISGVYQRYDGTRLADSASHEGNAMLRKIAIDSIDGTTQGRFKREILQRLQDTSIRQRMCERIDKIGKPIYEIKNPDADGGNKNKSDPDAKLSEDTAGEKKLWDQALLGYLKCPTPQALTQ